MHMLKRPQEVQEILENLMPVGTHDISVLFANKEARSQIKVSAKWAKERERETQADSGIKV